MKKYKKLKITVGILCLLLIIAIPLCYYLIYISYNHLTVNTYDIKSQKIENSNGENIKFVVVGDLHDRLFKSTVVYWLKDTISGINFKFTFSEI